MARQNRTLIGVLGGVLLLLAAGTTWWLLGGAATDAAPGSVLPAVGRAPAAGGAELLAPVASLEPETPELLPELAAPDIAVPPAPRVPESYRRALGALTGRVVESDGRPVPDLRVELAGGRKSLVLQANDAFLKPDGLDFLAIAGSAVTGPDGRFTLPELDPRTMGVLLLDPGGPRALVHALHVTPVSGVSQDLGDIVLPASVTLRGRIVDERGEPVAGARVRATDLSQLGMISVPGIEGLIGIIAGFRADGAVLAATDDDGREPTLLFAVPPSLARLESHLPLPTTTSGADGAFVLDGVPVGLVLLAVDEPDHLPLVQMNVPTGAAGGTRDLGALVLGDGLTLKGRVVNDQGEGVAGVEVLAGNMLPMVPACLLKAPVRTGADGAFAVRALASGKAYVAARKDAREQYTIVSTPDAGAGPLTVTLTTGRQWVLTVRDEQGLPVTDATLYGRATPDDEVPDWLFTPRPLAGNVVSAEDGRYVVGWLHPAEWQFIVQAEGCVQQRVMEDLTEHDGADEVVLERGAELAVRVVRAADESPVEYARVEAFSGRSDFGNLITAPRTDAEGRVRLANLPAGELTLTITHPALAVTNVETSVPQDEELVVSLLQGAVIDGTVLENGGPPAEPLVVFLMQDGAPGDAELPRSTVTDEQGAFRFERVEPGTADLEARSRHELQSGFSLLEAMFNSPLAEAEVTVPAEGEVDAVLLVGVAGDIETAFVNGKITVNGRAGADWKVRTWGKIRRSATADERGDFDLGRVEAGSVDLMLSAPGAGLMQGFLHSVEVQLARDEHRFVSIDLATGSISGRLSSTADGSAVGGATVRAIDSEQEGEGWGRQGSAVTDAGGRFQIDPVVAGRYRLSARADGFANATSAVLEVHPLQQLTSLELRLHPALTASGVVVVEGADPPPRWLWLVATRGQPAGSDDGGGEGAEAGESSRDTSRVDREDHSFEFDGLSPGEWTFTLATDLETEFEPVTLALDRDVSDLQLTFHPAPDEPEPAAESEGATFIYEMK